MTTLQKIESAINFIKEGYTSQYITSTNEAGDSVRIRVSNHPVNPDRINANDLSIVVDGIDNDPDIEEGGCNFCISKKTFKRVENEYHVDEDGYPSEQFENLQELLNWHEIV